MTVRKIIEIIKQLFRLSNSLPQVKYKETESGTAPHVSSIEQF